MKYCRFPLPAPARTGRVSRQDPRNNCRLEDRGRRFVCGWQQRHCGGPFLHGIRGPVGKPDRR